MKRFLFPLLACGLAAVLLTGEALPCLANGVIHHESETQPKPPQKAPKKGKKKPVLPKKAPRPLPKPSPTPKPPTLLEQGRRLHDQRFFTRALDILKQAIALEPKNADCWFAIGETYEALGFFDEAQHAYKRTLELAPNHPELSRILMYPGSGEKKPLWDPKRPARISEIPPVTAGFVILPPESASGIVSPDVRPQQGDSVRTVQRGSISPDAPKQPAAPWKTPVTRAPSVVSPTPAAQKPQDAKAPVYVPPAPDHAHKTPSQPSQGASPVYAPPLPNSGNAPVSVPPQPGAAVQQKTQPAYIPPAPPASADASAKPSPAAPVYVPPSPAPTVPGQTVSGDAPASPPVVTE